MTVTQKIFIVEFGQKSQFLFHHTRVTTILSPLEGWVHHIDYMFIHLSCMYRDEKWVPYESTTILNEKTRKMKRVLTITSIFKSWSFWRQVWLASSLLEQILKNYSREVPSNRPIIFVQTPTMTQPEEIRGKHGQEPQHNSAFLQKLLWEGWPKGNCTTFAEWSLFLFCQKITTSVWSCLQNFLIFVSTCSNLCW